MSNPTCRCSAAGHAASSADYLEGKKDKKKQQLLGPGETFLSDTAREWHPEWQDHARKMWTSAYNRESQVRQNKIGEDENGEAIYTKTRSAQKVMIALPLEGKTADHVKLCQQLAEHFREQGRSGQWRIHYDRAGNPHAHFLLTVRQLDKATGQWADCKVKRVPKLDANGNKIPLMHKVKGEDGKYLRDKDGNFIYEQSYRINTAGRKCKVYQYEKVKGFDWDSKEYLQTQIRDKWEAIQNDFLRSVGAKECSLKKLTEQQANSGIEPQLQQLSTIHEGHEPDKADTVAHEKWEERVIFNYDRRTENDRRAEILRKGEKIYDTADDPELRAIREYLDADRARRGESIESEGRDYNSEGRADSGFDYTKYEIEARLDANARTLSEAGRSARTVEPVGTDTRELEERINQLIAAEKQNNRLGKGVTNSKDTSRDGGMSM